MSSGAGLGPGPPRRAVPLMRVGLRAKTLALVLACVTAPLLAAGFTLLQSTERLLGERVREALSSQLALRSAALDAWLTQRQRDAARWSASFVVYEGLEALSRGAPRRRVEEELGQYLRSVMERYDDYEALAIVSPEGELLAATRQERLEPWVRALLSAPTGAPAEVARLSPLRHSDELGRPTLVVVQPIPEPAGRPVGHLLLRLQLSRVAALLSEGGSSLAPPSWLLDVHGRVLLRPGVPAERPGQTLFPALAPGEQPRPGVREAHLPGLGTTVYATVPLRGPFPGHVAVTVPASDAYLSLDVSRRRLRLLVLAAIVLGSLLALATAQSGLQPILRLSEAARRVSAGDLHVRLDVRGSDELAELTRAFNGMTEGLRQGRARLEQVNADLREANRTLEELAITDALTGLYNRRHFEETLQDEIHRAGRDERGFGLLLMDLDHFKLYNDSWGHSEGDAALRRVAERVRDGLSRSDMVFRYGGEEFAALLAECTKERAVQVAEELRAAVEQLSDGPSRVTISVGVAAFPEDGRVARGLVDAADAALYAAKQGGRNRVMLIDGPAFRQAPPGRGRADGEDAA